MHVATLAPAGLILHVMDFTQVDPTDVQLTGPALKKYKRCLQVLTAPATRNSNDVWQFLLQSTWS